MLAPTTPRSDAGSSSLVSVAPFRATHSLRLLQGYYLETTPHAP